MIRDSEDQKIELHTLSELIIAQFNGIFCE